MNYEGLFVIASNEATKLKEELLENKEQKEHLVVVYHQLNVLHAGVSMENRALRDQLSKTALRKKER